jgi:hypothetical protein
MRIWPPESWRTCRAKWVMSWNSGGLLAGYSGVPSVSVTGGGGPPALFRGAPAPQAVSPAAMPTASRCLLVQVM